MDKRNRGRPSYIDVKALATFLSSYSSSYEDLRKLTSTSLIIQQAAEFLLNSSDRKVCFAIVMTIRRNNRGFSSYLSKPRINILQNIVITPDIMDTLSAELSDNISEQTLLVKPTNDVFNETSPKNTFLNNSLTDIKLESELQMSNLDASEESQYSPQSDSKEDLTTTNEEIPEELLKLDRVTSAPTKILPENSTNLKEQPPNDNTGYGDCIHFEGSCIITVNEWNSIFQNGCLMPGWTYLITKKLENINNVCVINFKSKHYNSVSKTFKIYAYCAHKCKKFNIFIKNVDSQIDHGVDVYSSSVNYHHVKPITKYLKGTERKIVRQHLKFMKPSKYRTNVINKSSSLVIKEMNLQRIKSDDVVKKARSEMLGLNDRDKDDLIDVILMQRNNYQYIKQVGQPFHIYMFSEQQLEVLDRCSYDEQPELHIDATGSIVRKPKFVAKKIFYYTGVIRTRFNNRIFPILEMISCDHDSVSIGMWLSKFKSFCLKRKRKWPIFSAIVTDFSFSLINAISIFFNDLHLLHYLEITFDHLRDGNDLPNHIIPLHICCAHFLKIIVNDIKKCITDESSRKIIKEIVASAFNFTDLNKVLAWFENLVPLLFNEYVSVEVDKALLNLLRLCCDGSVIVDEISSEYTDTIHRQSEEGIYMNSPYFKLFKHRQDEIISKMDDRKMNTKNQYFSRELLKVILKKIAYLPMWTGILFKNKQESFKRFSNAEVENWFNVVKHLVLENLDNQKCSRVIRKIRKTILSIHKEITSNIPKSACTSRRAKKSNSTISYDYVDYLEEWNRKLPPKNNTFRKKNLGALYSILKAPTESLNAKSSESKRTYLQLKETDSQDDETDDEGWISQLDDRQVPEELGQKCYRYLGEHIFINDELVSDIEKQTREQRECAMWFSERKIRLTSSNFGRIFKAKTEKTKGNILKQLLSENKIHSIAIEHGIKHEKEAIDDYITQTGRKVSSSGLILDGKNPFLACSPDGLVGDEGIIEVKCPYSIRYEKPELAIKNGRLKYFDKELGLKKNHIYYHQIQGLLNITKRNWCDMVIWTWAGMFIIRIARNKAFWSEVVPKLTDFYLFYMLPQLVAPNTESLHKRQWSVSNHVEPLTEINSRDSEEMQDSNLSFYNNGLVQNVGYYQECSKYGNYAVAKYSTKFSNDLLYEDFKSLNDKQWLTDFAVNYCLIALIKYRQSSKAFVLLTTNQTCAIFHHLDELQDEFYEGVDSLDSISKKTIIVMPIIIGTISSRNHWVLAVADLQNGEFSYLDARTSSPHDAKKYKTKFETFIERYLRYRNIRDIATTFEVKIISHIRQRDGYNCGVFIIYFFNQMLLSESLLVPKNMDEYRVELKSILLETADENQMNWCLVCGSNSEEVEVTNKCSVCKRNYHTNCSSFKSCCCLCDTFA